jgi:hypothetical protein
MGERMYRSTFSWPRHYLEVSGQLHAPAALPPRKEPPVPIGEEVGWTSEPVWKSWRRENSWPHRDSNSDFSVVQPVASRYTDYAIPAPSISAPTLKKYMKYRFSNDLYWHVFQIKFRQNLSNISRHGWTDTDKDGLLYMWTSCVPCLKNA